MRSNIKYEICEPSKSILKACEEANEMAMGVDIEIKIVIDIDKEPNSHKDILGDAIDIAEKESNIDDFDQFYFEAKFLSGEQTDISHIWIFHYIVRITSIEN